MKNFVILNEDQKIGLTIVSLALGLVSFMLMIWFLCSIAASFDALKGSWGVFLPALKFIKNYPVLSGIMCLPGISLVIWGIWIEKRKSN